MTVQEWTTIDKSGWDAGPWQDEPDKIQWVDPATDLDCLMVRHERSGHWCGYVGVAAGHPAFRQYYNDVDVDVHGGLTFASECQEDAAEGHGVCHVPEPGRPAHVWWLGFDCHHAHDMAPGLAAWERDFNARHPEFAHLAERNTYRDRACVERETAHLAAQLAAAL